MSRTVDTRVVEMQFDNKHFEQNVSTTMSTLDKLKQSLKLGDSSKGLDNLSKAAKNVDMNGLGNAVEDVRMRFSALQVMGVTALTNITNSAVNAGKRFVESLTIAPIKDGFGEYEMTLNAIQTTMAGTGKTAKEVELELKKLDEYADKTVYSTSDMLNNLPKFTNAGVELEKATTAMIGIANATALAGGDASKASIAFYNLGQAIGTGYLTRIDYNSINGAGIATMEWKNQMVEAAIAAGTLTKVGEDSYKAGKKTFTLQQLFIDGLQEQWATTDVMMKVFGDYGDETTEIGKKSYSAAQDIKTFSMMMDSLKATAGTGWKDTWQIIFGDLDEAKVFWTGLSNFISSIIEKFADVRNGILEGALGKSFGKLKDNFENLVKPAVKAMDTVKETVNTVADLGKIVDEVIGGKFGNGEDRFNALSEAGINYYEVQNKVNEKLGDSYRHSDELIKKQNELLGIQKKSNDATEDTAKSQSEVTEAQTKHIAKLAEMSEAELESLGYTKEQIAAFKELKDTADKLGLPLEEFISNIDKIDGRWLLIESFKNAGKGLLGVFTAIRDAWQDIFPPKSIEERSEQLFNLIAALHKFSRSLLVNDETADKLRSTFKGVFAIVDVLTTVLGGGFKVAFKVISSILSYFNLDILDVTANIGDALVEFNKWFNSLFDISGVLDNVVPLIGKAVGAIKEMIGAIKESDAYEKALDIVNGLIKGLTEGAPKIWESAVEMAKGLWESFCDFMGIESPSKKMEEGGGYIIDGLINGLQNGASNVLNTIKDIFQPVLDFVKGLDFGAIMAAALGVFGAGTAYKAVGAIENLSAPLGGLGEVFEGVGEVLKKSAKPIAKVIKSSAKVVKNFAKVVKSFSNVLNGIAFEAKTEGIKNLGVTLLMLVGAIAVLTLLDPKEMWNAVAAVAALGAILVGLAFAIDKISSTSIGFEKGKLNMDGLKTGLIGIGVAMLLLGVTVKMLGSLNPEQAKQGFLGLAGLVVAIGIVMGSFAAITKVGSTGDIDKFGKTIIKMSIAMLLMTLVAKMLGGMDINVLQQGLLAITAFGLIIIALMGATRLISGGKNVDSIGSSLMKIGVMIGIMGLVVKLLGEMNPDQMAQGLLAITAFSIMIIFLMGATKLVTGSKNVDAVGSTLLKIGVMIGIMGLVVKMLGTMDRAEILQGTLAVAAFGGIIVGLMAATKLISGSKNIEKIGGALLAISGAIAIMALTAFMLSMVSWEGFAKGTLMITAFGGIIVGLMAATRLVTGSKNVEKIGATMIAIAGAIGILALIAVLLSLVPVENLVKGITVIAILSGIMAGLIAVTKLAKGCVGNLVVLTVAIAVFAGAIYLLSTIDPSGLVGATAALSIVLGVFALVIASSSLAGKAMGTLIVLTVAIAVLSAALYMLAGLPVESVMGSALGLSALLITIAAVCALMGAIPVAAAANAALGLSAFIGIMAGLLLVLGGLSKIPGFNELIADGGQTLSLIGNALGSFVGSIVAGFAGAALSVLPMFGVALSGFMIGVQPFIECARDIDGSVLTGVGILSAAILALTAADLVAGVSSFLQGGSSFADLGTQLSQFMQNALPFITMASSVTPEMLSGVKALADTILILTAADLLQGLSSFITGGSSLESFATQLPLLGQGLAAFSASLGSFTEEQLATVNCAANAVKTLAQASSEIPNAGGLLGMLVGENDLGTFASQFPILGGALRAFITSIGTFGEEQIATVTAASNAIKTLAQASSEIPNSGGLLGQIVGENDLGTFASQFPMLGSGLRAFIESIGTFSDAENATVTAAAEAIKTLASASSEIPNSGGWLAQIVGDNNLGTFAAQFPMLGIGLRGFLDNVGTLDDAAIKTVTAGADAVSSLASVASTIPNEGGWISKIVGDNDLGTFSSNFPALGKGLRGFIDEIGAFSSAQVATIYAAISAINALAGLANADLKGAAKHLSGFSDDLPNFGSDMSEFCSNMPSAENMNSAVANLNTLLTAVENIGNANSGVLSTFATNLKKVSSDAVKKFIEAFTSNAAKTDLKNAAKTLAGKAVDGVETQEDEMESAGKDLGAGLVNGIKAKWQAAYNAGYTLGQKAVQGEKDGQASNSPSKLTIQAGKWLGEGLVIGIKQMGDRVYNAGSGLGESATKSISSAISQISDNFDGDMNLQPTIRPVLDLSDVRSGAGSISSLLGAGSSVGLNANVGVVASMMNRRGQNGVNAELVSAINKLRKDVGNMGNTTYSINGITYDDGSNVSEAVKSLVRAAKIERRV